MLVELAERFECKDGGLYWKYNRTNAKLIGKRAGCTKSDGYRYVKVLGRQWQEHRLVVIMNGLTIGEDDVVHHIDGDRLNNDIGNLVVWDKVFHKCWHKTKERTPLCYRFGIGVEYSRMLQRPSGYKHKVKATLTDEQILDGIQSKADYRKRYYKKNREKIIQKALDSYYRRKAEK